MFVLGEGPKPTEESSRIISQFAEQLISCFKDADHITAYYDTHRTRFGFDLDYADKFLRPSDRIMEVGAYPYFLTLPLMSKNYDVTALDKSSSLEYSHAPAVADKFKLKAIHCDLDNDKIPENDASFDCVIMNEVFEHLRINLISSMREVCRVLRPGGLLLLSTPNLRSVRGIYNLLRRQEAYCSMGGIYENYSYHGACARIHLKRSNRFLATDWFRDRRNNLSRELFRRLVLEIIAAIHPHATGIQALLLNRRTQRIAGSWMTAFVLNLCGRSLNQLANAAPFLNAIGARRHSHASGCHFIGMLHEP